MYYSLGIEKNLGNILHIVRANGREADSLATLKEQYLKTLNQIQPEGNRQIKEMVDFCLDPKEAQRLVAYFLQDCALTDLKSTASVDTPQSSMQAALKKVEDALEEIKSRDLNLYGLFNTAISTLVYVRSLNQGGGSISSILGLIWCSHRRTWNLYDVAEFLVHELTHNLLFVDELAHGHYQNIETITCKDTYCYSAILNKQRPLDKVFHSLFVAIEVMEFRKAALSGEVYKKTVHPQTPVMIEHCTKTIESIDVLLENRSDLVQPRFDELFKLAKSKMAKLAFESKIQQNVA